MNNMKTYTKTTVTKAPLLEIVPDVNPMNPREWDNLGYFITVDRNYHSPDQNPELEKIVKTTADEADNQAEHMELIKREIEDTTEEKVIAIYPVVKYEHSGISYSLGTKHGFDYSNNGFYIVTDKTSKLIGTEPKDFERVIKGELETYNKYANGTVYGFALYDDKGELVDSCSGFYDIEEIRGNLPEEWKDEDLSKYIIN